MSKTIQSKTIQSKIVSRYFHNYLDDTKQKSVPLLDRTESADQWFEIHR